MRPPFWLLVVWVVAILNFASFAGIAMKNGGDAINGKQEDGKYYLGDHGNYTEVSKAFFQYSRVHAILVWITHPVAILGAIWFVTRKKSLAEK